MAPRIPIWGIESSPGEYAGSRALTCRFGDPRKENCDMMCRPLRAVMVGHRYAIIVPEVRGIRRAPRSRSTSQIRHTFCFFLFLTSAPEANAHAESREPSLSRVQPPRRGATRDDGTPVRPVVAAQLHSNRSKSVAVRCRHMHSHCHTRK